MLHKRRGKWTIESLSASDALKTTPILEERQTLILRHEDLGIVMSDSTKEMEEMSEFVKIAHGDVLIAGLGLGLVIDKIKHKVDSITIIENSQDVIDLVPVPYKIIKESINTYTPDRIYDCIWIDVWENNWHELDHLKEYCKPGGFGIWSHDHHNFK